MDTTNIPDDVLDGVRVPRIYLSPEERAELHVLEEMEARASTPRERRDWSDRRRAFLREFARRMLDPHYE